MSVKSKLIKAKSQIYNYPKCVQKRSRKYIFEDRRKNSEHLIYVLSGYKPELWDNVFERLKRVSPSKYDFCIISAGKYVKKLTEIAKNNGWSYLSTKANNVPYIQNLVIELHLCAQFIWKFDEDMYVYYNYFDDMFMTYQKACAELNYEICFTAPLIPINSYGFIKFLHEINKLSEYERLFLKGHKAVSGNSGGQYSGTLWSAEAQKYIWEVTGNFDDMAERIQKKQIGYTICPVRFSIGAIMYTREVWEEMGGFPETYAYHYNDGEDEVAINMNCMKNARVIVCCDNVLVAHFSFGGVYEAIAEHLKKHNYLERRNGM
mgnify:FL=1